MTIEARFELHRPEFTLDVDLRIAGRGVTTLFGRSGCGKTTLLRCMAGLEPTATGRLVVGGDIWQDAATAVPPHRRAIGYVFQEGRLFPHLTVRGNLEYGYRRIARERRLVKPAEVSDLLGLEPLLGRRPHELSGGQRQRVAIGRALLTGPRILLMDEPLAALDAMSKQEILPYLERLHDELQIPVLYVSHALEEVVRLADHMVLMADGRVLAHGGLRDLLTRADLPLAHGQGASTVIEAEVRRHHDRHHLTELAFPGGTLMVSREDVREGQRLRVRIMARDVAISLSRPRDSSVLNCLPVRVLEVTADPHPGHVLMRLGLQDQVLLARITRRSLEHLGLVPDMAVHALVKGVAIT